MNKYTFFQTICLISIFFASCKKENNVPNLESEFTYNTQSTIPYHAINVVSKGFSGKSGSNKVVFFQAMDDLKYTLMELERQVNDRDSVFNKTYAHLSSEELEAKVDELNYRSEEPLYDFNKELGIESLFSAIAAKEVAFLDQENPDWSRNPDDHFIDGLATRAFLNLDCEVMIGDTIYKLTEDGYYAIANKDFKSLALIEDNESIENLDNVTYFGPTGEDFYKNPLTVYAKKDCKTNKRISGYRTSGNYKIKYVLSIWTHPWDQRIAIKHDSYKKNKKGKWRKEKLCVSMWTWGKITNDADCTTNKDFNPNGIYYSKCEKAGKLKIYVNSHTQSGWVHGRIKCNNVGIPIDFTVTLTW